MNARHRLSTSLIVARSGREKIRVLTISHLTHGGLR